MKEELTNLYLSHLELGFINLREAVASGSMVFLNRKLEKLSRLSMKSEYHLSNVEKPSWLKYPKKFDSLLAEGKDDFDLWYLMESIRVLERRKGLLERYPHRDLVPFAKRDDNDDVACWDRNLGSEKVIVIHDFASSGYEEKAIFDSFEKWLENALIEAEEF